MPSLLAHAGPIVAPHDLATAWPFQPVVVITLVGGWLLYVRGLARLWVGEAGRRAVLPWRAWCFVAATLVAALALVSPLEPLATTLFAAHMAQHLLLVLLLAPLLVLARTTLVVTMALPPRLRRPLGRVRLPVSTSAASVVGWAAVALILHAGTFWTWHVPRLYEGALRSDGVHAVEHATLVLGGVALWWLVADARGRHANAAGVLAVFGAVLQSGMLAALLTFAGDAWYPVHAAGAAAWGLSALEDQHLAGGLMWFPGAPAYILGGTVVFFRWLRDDERSVEFALRR